jgi:hypothetical protein
MSVNYCRLVSMTDEEKRKMYKKNTKKQLIDMLIASSNANELLYDEIQKLTRISLGNKQPIYTNSTNMNKPYVDAHNKSYELSNGDYLFRIDCDDNY